MDQFLGPSANTGISTGSPEENIHQVISLIYQAASDPERWQDLLEGIAEFVENRGSAGTRQDSGQRPDNSGDHYSLHKGLQQVQQFSSATGDEQANQQVSDLLTFHFKNALDIAHRLVQQEEYQEVIHDVIDRLPIGVIIVDKDRRILKANSNAKRYVENNDDLRMNSGHLGASNPDVQARLDRIIKELSRRAPTAENGNMELISIADGESAKLLMFLMPAHGGLTTDGFSNTIIFLSHPKSLPIGIPAEVQQAYDLSNRESEVLGALARGFTVKEIAEQDSVSEATLRTQLKSLFNKTKTSRQADLVKLVLSIPSGSPQAGVSSVSALLAQNQYKGVLATTDGAVQIMDLPDGRRLSYREYGRPNGFPMLFLHSSFGSHLEARHITHRACVEQGIRVIAPNRPGFSHSDPSPSRTVVDWVDDMAALADHLGLDQFYVYGHAIGGIYAWAIGAKLPDRVKKLLIVSSSIEARTAEDWAQKTTLYRFAEKLARDWPSGYRLLFNIMVKGFLKNPTKLFKTFMQDLVPEEVELFKSELFCQQLVDEINEGHRQGGYHSAQDVIVAMREWEYLLDEIKAPTHIWHGAEDRHVPYALGKKLAERVPHSEFISVPGASHFMVFRNFDQILERFLADA